MMKTGDDYLMRMKVRAKLFLAAAMFLFVAMSAAAKAQVDFNPEIDFTQYKTFAYLGGTDQLVMLQLNPDLISDRVHRSVTRELTGKGLREVKAGENPDMVVRYWATSSKDADVSVVANVAIYEPFIGSYWGFWYTTVTATSKREGTLLVDLIDPKKKDLVWRVYIIRRITNVDKVWKQADEDFTKGFESYPPSAKEVADKRKERLDHKPKDASLQ